MAMLSGLLYTTNVEDILQLPHEKSYQAKIRKPTSQLEAIIGYQVIKLTENVTWFVGWREDDMNEFVAKKGEYLVQCFRQPPRIIKTWAELRKEFKVFRNTKEEVGN